MAKALNQQEIDFLLSAGGLGEEADLEALEAKVAADAKRRISPYNFKRPRLFSQEQTRVLQYVHEAFARDLSVYLSAQLRTMVEITLTAVDQVLFSEYVASSAAPSALYVGEAQGTVHQMVFEIDPRFVVYTIEKLFGGPGVFPEEAREPSQIERRIMSKVVRRAFDELEASWRQAHELRLREVAFETNAEFVQILPSMEPAMVATFDLRLQGHRSFLNICYPYLLLEEMLGRAGMQRWYSGTVTEVPPPVRARYEEALRTLHVTLRAELGRTRLSIDELAALEPGDIVPLHRRATEPLSVYIGKHEKFRAAAGRSGKQRALRILEVLPAPAEYDPLAADDRSPDR